MNYTEYFKNKIKESVEKAKKDGKMTYKEFIDYLEKNKDNLEIYGGIGYDSSWDTITIPVYFFEGEYRTYYFLKEDAYKYLYKYFFPITEDWSTMYELTICEVIALGIKDYEV